MADPKKSEVEEKDREICGIIMPISATSRHGAEHWIDVKSIISRAINKVGMRAQLVSDSLETDVIHGRIILNVYQNPIVICDVSGLNPNVMFELGMRLTFKKPTIVVTDDISTLPFDTKVIEHLAYPSDLHFHQIEKFIDRLADKIVTLRDQNTNGTYKSFIENFGTFDVVAPETEAVSADKFILDKLGELTSSIRRIERSVASSKDFYRRSDLVDRFYEESVGTSDEDLIGSSNEISFTIRIPEQSAIDLHQKLMDIPHVKFVKSDRISSHLEKYTVSCDQKIGLTLFMQISNAAKSAPGASGFTLYI